MSKRVLFFVGLLALSSVSIAADREVETLLLRMRNAYKSVKTAHFITRSKTPVAEGEWIIVSDVTYQAPNKIHAKMDGIPANASKVVTLVSDGKTIKLSGIPSVQAPSQPFSMENFSQSTFSAMNLESLNFWDYERQLSTTKGNNMAESELKVVPTEMWGGKNWIVLEEKAPRSGVFVRYLVDPKSYFVKYVRIMDISGNVPLGDTELLKLEVNGKVNASLFKHK